MAQKRTALGVLLGLALCLLPAFGCDEQRGTNVLGATVATASDTCAMPTNEDALAARVIDLVTPNAPRTGWGPCGETTRWPASRPTTPAR